MLPQAMRDVMEMWSGIPTTHKVKEVLYCHGCTVELSRVYVLGLKAVKSLWSGG